MNENFNFKKINTKREYIDSRLKLEKTFILFFGYSEEESSVNDWSEVLTSLEEQFKETMQIVVFSDKAEEKLVSVLLDESESDISKISFPRVVLCHPHLTEPQLLKELDPYELFKIVEDCDNFYKTKFEKEKMTVFSKIEKILSSFPIVVFIKGTPHDPFCKYSKTFIEIMKATGVRYRSFDIFRDDTLRSYLRLYSGWKTYPQLYINGKIFGGLDVLKDSVDKGEFMKLVPKECTRDYAKEGVLKMIEENKTDNLLLVFGKGDKSTAKCKSSKEAYVILDQFKIIDHKVVDVMKDEMMRDLVKEVSGYNYYPQVYYQGKFLGGLKYLKEGGLNKLIK